MMKVTDTESKSEVCSSDPWFEIFIALDLDDVMQSVRDQIQLTDEQAEAAELWYRRFLWLCYKYPRQMHIPIMIIDIVWHAHILFTERYTGDCARLFGHYLHHRPHVGVDRHNPIYVNAFEETARKFEAEFHEPMTALRERFPDQADMAKSGRSCTPSW